MGPGDATTRRVFLGIALEPELAEIVVERTRPALVTSPSARSLAVYPASDLHLTLAFLGQFPAQHVRALGERLARDVGGLPAPQLVVDGAGAFPSRERPRVLWVGALERGGARRLEALREATWRVATSAGWHPPRAEAERPFRPHVTVARVRREGRFDPAFFDLELGLAWRPKEVCLFESCPGEGPGARYPVLASAAI